MEEIPPHMRSKFHEKMLICSRIKEHQYGPWGYNEWHEWAKKKGQTHEQLLCDCGFYVIWRKKNEK